MNVVNYLDRMSIVQTGNLGYDFALKRLHAVNPDQSVESGIEDPFGASICKFCKTPGNEDYLATANELGNVRIENTRNERRLDYEFRAHRNAIFDLEWSDCHNRLLLGSGEQTASLWDLREGGISKVNIFSAHNASVRSVAFRPFNKDVFATGARDGLIIIWDARCASSNVFGICIKPENIIDIAPITRDCMSGSKRRMQLATFSICSLLFQDDVRLFSTSISESCVDVWDMRKIYTHLKRIPQPLYKLSPTVDDKRNYYLSMCMNSSRTRLYANCRDGTIHGFNAASFSPKPETCFTGHEVGSTYIKCCLSPDDRYLLCGSSDGKAYLWSTVANSQGSESQAPAPKATPPIAELNGDDEHAELSCVDWCRSGEIKIATCTEHDSYQESIDRVPLSGVVIWKVATDDADDTNRKETKEGQAGTVTWKASAPVHRKCPRIYRACRPITVKKPTRIDEMNSPTVNLPNHVIDGTSPLHRCSPSSRKEKENRNWLSSLKKKTTPCSIKSRTTPSSHNPKTTPSSLNSKSVQIRKSNGAHKPKACGSLLKFFKAAATKESAVQGLTEVSNFPETSIMTGVMEI